MSADFTPTLTGYSGQNKFRYWCQKVLPLVYDDSLSYYELLGKVVEYLNNTISDVSACEDNITALRDAFVQLQDYVNDMFDDFSPEIERIIDEMIDNGEFGEILTDVVNGLIANEYSTTQGYAQFDYALKDGKLYCSTAPTSGEWDATKWRETTVCADMQLLNQRVYNLNAGQVTYNPETTYGNGTVGKELQKLNSIGKNPLAGKNIGFWGDSIMYGLLQNGNRSESNYPKVLGDLTGATVENNAYSGASITNYDEHSFINIYQNINWNNYDIAVLGYGANDVGHGETIANIQSAFETVTGYMMSSNPNLIIALCSPTYGANLTGRYQPSNICLNDVYYIVRNVAKARRLKFIDFLYGSSINEFNINTLSWDGLHFNDAGYYKLGEYLASNLLGETIHDVIDFGTHAQKLQVQHFGGNAGCNLYIYGDDNTIYSITFYVNAMALTKSDDGGANWTTLWTLTPST